MHANGFSLLARRYADAARVTFPPEPAREITPIGSFEMVPYDLASHAIELALKAFLILRGLTIEKLRQRYGHDLRKLLRKARSCGLDSRHGDPARLQACVDHLDAPHRERSFGYPQVQHMRLPSSGDVLLAVDSLVTAVHAECRAQLLLDLQNAGASAGH